MYKVKIPGSLMIMGEHSVLTGKPAIISAINQYIYISITKNYNNQINIISDRFPNYQSHLNNIIFSENFAFILYAIEEFKEKLDFGINIEIKSDFAPTLGLGSSASIICGILSCLMLITEQQINKKEIFSTD